MTVMPINVIDVIDDPNLLGQWFHGSSWDTWRAVLKAANALPMTRRERQLFRAVAERSPPRKRVKELWVVAGRRAGKDSIASAVATTAAISAESFAHLLRPGELAAILCLACDRTQAGIVLRYVKGYFERVPLLRDLVTREIGDGLELSTGVEIIVATNDYRAVRGRTLLAVIMDEVAFYADEGTESSDVEVYNALVPGLSTLPGAMLIGISSPYKRSGLLYQKWRDHYGQDDSDVLVIRAPSLTLNSTLDRKMIDAALERDPQAAASEWLAEWRTDISGFLDPVWIDRAATLEAGELPPKPSTRYECFIDPSGGRVDAMTIGIAHREDERVVVDLCKGRKAPFDPASVVREFAETMKRYSVRRASADRYAGEWVTSSFKDHGVTIDAAERSKSEIYLEAEPLFAQGSISIPNDRVVVRELHNLERRTHRGGRDSVDHPPGHHDDYANALCGAAWLAAAKDSAVAKWLRL